jgi:hypothetical protein
MGLAEIQAALARLYVDAALRERFLADPEDLGAEFGLGADEIRVLAGVSPRQVEQFAGSLRRKRRSQVRGFLPIATRALGDRYGALFERYVAEAPLRGSTADIDDAIGFVEALGRWGVDDRPLWVVDLARYELAWSRAARAGRRPVVRVFRYPVGRLIRERRLAGPVAPRPTLAIWWRWTPRGRIRHAMISWPL